MKRDSEVEKVITRAMSAADIMALTGHNKGTIYKILNRLINENKIKKTKFGYAPTGYSDKFISNERTPSFCADPFGLSGLQKHRRVQSALRQMQVKNSRYGAMQNFAATNKRFGGKVRAG